MHALAQRLELCVEKEKSSVAEDLRELDSPPEPPKKITTIRAKMQQLKKKLLHRDQLASRGSAIMQRFLQFNPTGTVDHMNDTHRTLLQKYQAFHFLSPAALQRVHVHAAGKILRLPHNGVLARLPGFVH